MKNWLWVQGGLAASAVGGGRGSASVLALPKIQIRKSGTVDNGAAGCSTCSRSWQSLHWCQSCIYSGPSGRCCGAAHSAAPGIAHIRQLPGDCTCVGSQNFILWKRRHMFPESTCSCFLTALTKQRQTKKAPTHHSPSRLFQSERLPAVTLTGTKSRASCTLIIFSADGFWREPPCEPYWRPPVSSLHRSTIPGIGIGRRHRNLKFQNCPVELFLLLQISWPRRRC